MSCNARVTRRPTMEEGCEPSRTPRSDPCRMEERRPPCAVPHARPSSAGVPTWNSGCGSTSTRSSTRSRPPGALGAGAGTWIVCPESTPAGMSMSMGVADTPAMPPRLMRLVAPLAASCGGGRGRRGRRRGAGEGGRGRRGGQPFRRALLKGLHAGARSTSPTASQTQTSSHNLHAAKTHGRQSNSLASAHEAAAP